MTKKKTNTFKGLVNRLRPSKASEHREMSNQGAITSTPTTSAPTEPFAELDFPGTHNNATTEAIVVHRPGAPLQRHGEYHADVSLGGVPQLDDSAASPGPYAASLLEKHHPFVPGGTRLHTDPLRWFTNRTADA